MSLKEYRPGTTFNGRMGRTVSESEPAWPTPLRSAKGGRLHYVHNYVGAQEFSVSSDDTLQPGKHSLRYEFAPTGPPDLQAGKGTPGVAKLFVDGNQVGTAEFPVTIPLALGIGGGLTVGRAPGSPVSHRYTTPFAYTGTISTVTYDVSVASDEDIDEVKKSHARVAMARQ